MKNLIIFILFMFPLVLLAQPAGIESILNNDAYLVGRGEDRNFERADQLALADLSRLISVTIQSSFLDVQRESNLELSEFAESVIKTYSSSIIDGAERKTEQLRNGDYRVIRYLLKADKNKIFRQREAKIREYVKTGSRAEDVNNFDIALRNYYWALVLLQSHPERNEIFAEVGGESKLLTVFLPARIQDLLRGVKLKAANRTEGDENCVINISAENNRGCIGNLNLKYFDGEEFIPASVKDGKGAIYLPKNYLDNVSVINAIIDYQFNDQLGSIPLDEEVKMVAEQIFIPFDNQKNISIGNAPQKALKPEIQSIDDDELIQMTQDLVDAIKSRNFASVREQFSDQGYEQFLQLMNYGEVRLYEGRHSIKFVRFGDRILIRTIPLVIQLTDRSQKVVYDEISPIVENGRIVWTNFTINDRDAEDAINRGTQMGDLNERLLCLTFMEYYKTIFALKDIQRISDIFRDDAVIFVGYAKGSAPVPQYLGDAIHKSVSLEDFELIRLSKSEYLERLEQKAFRNPFVNIQFSELEVDRRSAAKPIFAIQLRQDYYSTNYADKGYLLLFTDNSDSSQPKIFFRCWQPKKFLDIYDIKIE